MILVHVQDRVLATHRTANKARNEVVVLLSCFSKTNKFVQDRVHILLKPTCLSEGSAYIGTALGLTTHKLEHKATKNAFAQTGRPTTQHPNAHMTYMTYIFELEKKTRVAILLSIWTTSAIDNSGSSCSSSGATSESLYCGTYVNGRLLSYLPASNTENRSRHAKIIYGKSLLFKDEHSSRKKNKKKQKETKVSRRRWCATLLTVL